MIKPWVISTFSKENQDCLVKEPRLSAIYFKQDHKKYRDRALKKLTAFLTKKTSWTPLEWDKLWKALYYCMWMSDKRPVQQELALGLASLTRIIPDVNLALLFVESFFRTIHREWHGIDGLRLDKFYNLIRQVLYQTLCLLSANEWEEALVRQLASILSKEILIKRPNGLRMHLCDIFLQELNKAGGSTIQGKAFTLLMEPFIQLFGFQNDCEVLTRVKDVVLTPLMTSCHTKDTQNVTERKSVHLDVEGCDTDAEDNESETRHFQHIKLDSIQCQLFLLATLENTPERNRKALYEMSESFSKVTKADTQKLIKSQKTIAVEPAKKTKANLKVAQEDATPLSAKRESTSKGKDVGKPKKRRRKVDTKESTMTKNEEPAERVDTPIDPKIVSEAPQDLIDKVEDKIVSRKRDVEGNTTIQSKAVHVVRNGVSFQRCDVCFGFGKGLLPPKQSTCRHCKRLQSELKASQKKTKKKTASTEIVEPIEEPIVKAKTRKVSFGKHRSLPYEVSVKRLKAHAKLSQTTKLKANKA
uniref:Ribosomal RNA processing protein 1 putative n=1 Tax=Albugo laibachii Nc14 TaxID=890382 RepID=F0WEP0_9STRA|nr:ribosomal RNA processing protein 1 putative [Albugo laibachii Nc14]|eukprot:CCA19672.1 ribosomal RNA processing protein 1 putative [Albugo laibachii Nc14]